VDAKAEDSKKASSFNSPECVSNMVVGLEKPFTRTILRREGMSGTTPTLTYSEEEMDASEVQSIPSVIGDECIDDENTGLSC
jgi:hypothetical protein